MIQIVVTLIYYVVICFAALLALALFGPLFAIVIAGAALLARHFFGPLSGRKAVGHGMLDGLVAVSAVFANLAVIVLAIIRLLQA